MHGVELTGPLLVTTPSGEWYSIAPGARGRGLKVMVVKGPMRPVPRGRPPRPGTLALRERLQRDTRAGKLASSGEYLRLVRQADPLVGTPTAWQIVHRETTAVLKMHPKLKRAPSARREAAPLLAALQKKLRNDAEAGRLKEAPHYVAWLLKQDKKLGLQRARRMVYRQRLRALEE